MDNTSLYVLFFLGILMTGCVDGFYIYAIWKRTATVERKLDALLAKMGVDVQGYVNDSINHIAELYRAGKVTEAKQLAKDTLRTPEEIKKVFLVAQGR